MTKKSKYHNFGTLLKFTSAKISTQTSHFHHDEIFTQHKLATKTSTTNKPADIQIDNSIFLKC